MNFNTYLYFIAILLLNVFSSIYANGVVSNIKTEQNNFETLQHVSKKEGINTHETTLYSAYNDNTHFRSLFNIIEVEDKKSKLSKPSFSNYSKALSFSTPQLFKGFSEEFQKNIYHHLQKNTNGSKLRLHVRFQVFII